MRRLFYFDVVVKDDERAFLTYDGRFQRLLTPGRHRRYDPARRHAAKVVKVVHAEVPLDTALLFEKTHPQIASEHFEIIQTGANEVAIVSLDGQPKHLIPPMTTRAFWKTLTLVEVERIDTADDLRVTPAHRDKMDLAATNIVYHDIVQSHEAGLLFVDGEFQEQLPAGRHTFWSVGRQVR
ncbi:MAG: slipin family protein, partial [Hyphomicrobiaceae bacterium]